MLGVCFIYVDDVVVVYVEVGFLYVLQGVQLILVVVGGDDLVVEIGCGIEVVVVVVQFGLFECIGLGLFQYVEGYVGFYFECVYLVDYFGECGYVMLFGIVLCCIYVKVCCVLVVCGLCGLYYFVYVYQFVGWYVCFFVMC